MCSDDDDFNNRNLFLTAKLLKKGYQGLPVGFHLLRYSVLFSVESLSLLYRLVISCYILIYMF